MSQLLVRVRPHRRCGPASRCARRLARDDVARAVREDRGVQEADGLAVRVGLVLRERVQPRLPRLVHAGRAGERPGGLQLHPAAVPEPGGARPQHLLPPPPPPSVPPLPRVPPPPPPPRSAAASTRWSAPRRSSTWFPRAAMRITSRSRWRGSGITTATAAGSSPTRTGPTGRRRRTGRRRADELKQGGGGARRSLL